MTRLSSVVLSDRKAQTEIQFEEYEEIMNMRNKPVFEGDQALEQAAQRCCEVSCGFIQNLRELNSVQPALDEPSLAGLCVLDCLPEVPFHPNHSVIL